ncbi:hypothetical protein Glove_315g77 [Diversispora epigaea]|uniref:SAM domain-containing protein n=1 Tax=Diversispora epigaea TaxID=1348612 RepID=A0A397HV87_9GLOM|nr:hypothetical protein Glove_315g77 [Diversispora epigaea]
MASIVRKLKSKELITFLQKEDYSYLELNEDDLKILRKGRINGRDFLKTTKEEFLSDGMPRGPATRLADFAKGLSKQKLKSFSSCKSLGDVKEVFNKFEYDEADINSILPFKPEISEIDSNDERFKHCIAEIKTKIETYGPASGSNEAERCHFISTILDLAILITRRITKQKIRPRCQFEIIGNERTGRVDYAIKKVKDIGNEELIAITEAKQNDIEMGFGQNVLQLEASYQKNSKKRKAPEDFDNEFDYLYGIVTTATDWYFILFTPEKFYRIEKKYHIEIEKDVLTDDSELCKDVKRVVEVLVSLLKDRVEVDDSSDHKKARIKNYTQKKPESDNI